MRVFTHYTKISNEEEGIRWRTILQFGNSWEVKGSVVMKNPGAANFMNSNHAAINSLELLEQLKTFDDGELKAEWYEFYSDPTMKCIGNLFSEYYALKGSCLEGVIQIFNLFYLREADLGKALNKVQNLDIADMIDEDIKHLKAPVYLGFADLAWHKVYGKVAEKFFNTAKELGMQCWNADFTKNSYTHPLYLMMYGKNKPQCLLAKYQFFQNTLSPIISQDIIDAVNQTKVKLDCKNIKDEIIGVLDEELQLAPKEEKNHRYIFGPLELTITDAENGFVGFRHPRKGNSYYDYWSQEAPNEELYRDVLSKLGYDTEKSSKQKTWLARKSFNDYGNKEQVVRDKILIELKQINSFFEANLIK